MGTPPMLIPAQVRPIVDTSFQGWPFPSPHMPMYGSWHAQEDADFSQQFMALRGQRRAQQQAPGIGSELLAAAAASATLPSASPAVATTSDGAQKLPPPPGQPAFPPRQSVPPASHATHHLSTAHPSSPGCPALQRQPSATPVSVSPQLLDGSNSTTPQRRHGINSKPSLLPGSVTTPDRSKSPPAPARGHGLATVPPVLPNSVTTPDRSKSPPQPARSHGLEVEPSALPANDAMPVKATTSLAPSGPPLPESQPQRQPLSVQRPHPPQVRCTVGVPKMGWWEGADLDPELGAQYQGSSGYFEKARHPRRGEVQGKGAAYRQPIHKAVTSHEDPRCSFDDMGPFRSGSNSLHTNGGGHRMATQPACSVPSSPCPMWERGWENVAVENQNQTKQADSHSEAGQDAPPEIPRSKGFFSRLKRKLRRVRHGN